MKRALYLAIFIICAGVALAVTPNPGHDASRIGAGTFSVGDFAFNGSLNITGNLTVYANITAIGGAFEISNPNLTLVDSLNTIVTASQTALAQYGSYVVHLVSNVGSTNTLAVYDFSEPSSPILVGLLNDSRLNGSAGIAIEGKYAYVLAGYNRSLNIIDLSNPARPVIVSSLYNSTIFQTARAIAVKGDYAYIGASTNRSIIVVDISNVNNPFIVSTLVDSTNLNGISKLIAQGDYLYATATLADRFVIINTTNRESPTIVSTYSNSSHLDGANDFVLRDGKAFIASVVSNAIIILNVTNVTNPQPIGSYKDATLLASASEIVIAGKYAFVSSAYNSNPIQIFDISRANSPAVVRNVSISDPSISPLIVGNTYISTGYTTLNTYSISGTTAPTAEIGNLLTDKLTVKGSQIIGSALSIGTSLSVGPGGILTDGRLAVRNNTVILGSLNSSLITHTPQLCLNGDCRTTWPTSTSGFGNLTNGNGSSGYLPYFTNNTNLNSSPIYFERSSGNIGIGTTVPSQLFTIVSPTDAIIQLNDSSDASTVGALQFVGGNTLHGLILARKDTNTGSTLTFGVNNSEILRVTRNGVGINTTHPNATLHVIGVINGTSIYATTFLQGPNAVLDASSAAGGDLSGTLSNLQLGSGVVGATELAATTVTLGNFGNATEIPTYTVDADGRLTAATNITIQQGSTSASGLLMLTDSTSSTSTTTAATPNSVKTAYDLAATKGNVTSSNGTSGYLGKFTSATNLAASGIYQDSSGRIGMGTTSLTADVTLSSAGSPSLRFADTSDTSGLGVIQFFGSSTLRGTITARNDAAAGSTIRLGVDGHEIYSFTNKGLGVNNTYPNATLHVTGSVLVKNSTDHTVLNITENEVRIGSETTNITLLVNGSINATGAITQNAGFDVAEMFSATQAMGAGDLVSVTGPNTVQKATKADADKVIGAVSTQPGFILANPNIANPVLIGLSGRIPVKVQGPVSIGDFITISSTPGVGERATTAGFVIGRAIENNVNGVVMIIIQPTYFNPAVAADGTLVGGSNTKAVFSDESETARVVRDADFVREPKKPPKPDITLQKGKDVVITIG